MKLQNLCHAYFAVKKGKIRERGFMPDKKQEHKICGYRRQRNGEQRGRADQEFK